MRELEDMHYLYDGTKKSSTVQTSLEKLFYTSILKASHVLNGIIGITFIF